MENTYKIDLQQWPLVLISADGNPETEQILEELDKLARYLPRDECYAVVSDLRDMDRNNQTLRVASGQWTRKNEFMLQRLFLGTAIVVKNQLFLIALKAYLLFNPMLGEVAVFTQVDEARVWAEKKLAEAAYSNPKKAENP